MTTTHQSLHAPELKKAGDEYRGRNYPDASWKSITGEFTTGEPITDRQAAVYEFRRPITEAPSLVESAVANFTGKPVEETEEYYYLLSLDQSPVGNHALWWRPFGSGYTTDLDKAGLYPREDALARESEKTKAVLTSKADAKTERCVPWPEAAR